MKKNIFRKGRYLGNIKKVAPPNLSIRSIVSDGNALH